MELKTVERAMTLLQAFNRNDLEMTVAELTSRLRLPRTVVARLLATLEMGGFVERSPTSGKYRIGIAMCELGAISLASNPLLSMAENSLRQIAEETGFTAYLGTLHGGDYVILSLHEGRHPIRFVWSPGDRLPVATTAGGKAMLMYMDPKEVDEILKSDSLVGLTEKSLRTREALHEQIAAQRDKDWIPAIDESFSGVCAIGSAILASDNKPVAAISLSFLRDLSHESQFEEMGNLVLSVAQGISRRFQSQEFYVSGRKLPATAGAVWSG